MQNARSMNTAMACQAKATPRFPFAAKLMPRIEPKCRNEKSGKDKMIGKEVVYLHDT